MAKRRMTGRQEPSENAMTVVQLGLDLGVEPPQLLTFIRELNAKRALHERAVLERSLEDEIYAHFAADLSGGPFASRCTALRVAPESANRYWRSDLRPAVCRDYLEHGAARTERHNERLRSHLGIAGTFDRSRARELSRYLERVTLGLLPLFGALAAHNRANVPDDVLRERAEWVYRASDHLLRESGERRDANAAWGLRHREGIRRSRTGLRRALRDGDGAGFDDQFRVLLRRCGSSLERLAREHGHDWFGDWSNDPFDSHSIDYPWTDQQWADRADRSAMLASVEELASETGAGRRFSYAAAEFEEVCRVVYLEITGRYRVRYTKSEPSGGEYGRFLSDLSAALDVDPPTQWRIQKNA